MKNPMKVVSDFVKGKLQEMKRPAGYKTGAMKKPVRNRMMTAK